MKHIEKIGKRTVVTTINNEPSKTKSEFKEQCDVHRIMNQLKQGRAITHVARGQGMYQDVSEIPDLLQAYEKVSLAQDAFMTLPSELRKKLENDPTKLPSYLQDPKNNEEAIKYGLKEKLPQNDDKTTIQEVKSPPLKNADE